MNGVNKVILIGNLGKDPEIRYTQNGTAVVNFSLATTDSWTKEGETNAARPRWRRDLRLSSFLEALDALGGEVGVRRKPVKKRTPHAHKNLIKPAPQGARNVEGGIYG